MKSPSRNRLLALLLNGLPAWLLAVTGLAVIAASLLADTLGFGGQPGVFGWKQILGVVAGGAMAASGLWAVRRLWGQLRRWETGPQETQPGRRALPDGKPVYDSAELRIPFIYELRELYRYRYLLWNLISRDLKVRYKRSFLGFMWALVNPLLTMAVISVVFIRLFRFNVQNYPIFLLSGILLWRLFSSGTSRAMRSIVGSAGMMKKIYVPPSVFVSASIGSAVVNLLFALPPLLLLAVILGVYPNTAWIFLPVPIILTALFALGVGVIVSALAVFFADMMDIYDVILSTFYYLTPIIYPVSILPEMLARLESINPMYHLIDAFRIALIEGRILPLYRLGIAGIEVLAITTAGWYLFARLSDAFPYRT